MIVTKKEEKYGRIVMENSTVETTVNAQEEKNIYMIFLGQQELIIKNIAISTIFFLAEKQLYKISFS